MAAFDIFLMILMAAASALCLGLVFFLNKITKSVTLIQQDLSGLVIQIQPVIGNINDMAEKLNFVTEELKQPIEDAVGIIGEVKERIDVIFNYEEKLRTGIEAGISGVISGIKTFWNTYRGNGRAPGKKRFFVRM